jgi:7,8-dihydroneopterin aldolase/epimerase/oxygenase
MSDGRPRLSARPLGITVTPGEALQRRAAAQARAAAEAAELAKPVTSAASNRIFVQGLRIEAHIGCNPNEQGRTQPVVVDVDVWRDGAWRATEDALGETVDYDSVVAVVRAVFAEGHHRLVETVVERIAAQLLSDGRISRVRVRASKPQAIAGADAAGVEIERP